MEINVNDDSLLSGNFFMDSNPSELWCHEQERYNVSLAYTNHYDHYIALHFEHASNLKE